MNIITTHSEAHWIAEVDSMIASILHPFSLMLTGGRTAKQLYAHWESENFFGHRNTDFYFGDERCVPPEDPESNYGMAMNTLFNSGIPDGCMVHRIVGEADDVVEEASRYASILPDAVDVILLSIGEDGHIASIFPGSDTITEESASVSHVSATNVPVKRFTITPKVLKSANKIIVLACGRVKGKVVSQALIQPKKVKEFPVRLVLGTSTTTLILDKEASEEVQ
jgi:6-phosphogluconolactonase